MSVVGALAILFLIYVVYVVIRQFLLPAELAVDGPYEVVAVLDGDTIDVDVDGTVTRVRLIGIDTPELYAADEAVAGAVSPEGEAAAEYTRNLLEGNMVYIEYDAELLDNYGRTLCYVYLRDKRTMVNELILQNGYARTLTIEPNVKYRERLAAAEAAAKADGVGLWGD